MQGKRWTIKYCVLCTSRPDIIESEERDGIREPPILNECWVWTRNEAQNVLQFHAPWKLCAKLPTRASGRFAATGAWTGCAPPPLLLELSLLLRLKRRCSHSRNELWQRSQARCHSPSGWKRASSSRRTCLDESCAQKTPPHFLQWWRRLNRPNGVWHETAEHTGVELSAYKNSQYDWSRAVDSIDGDIHAPVFSMPRLQRGERGPAAVATSSVGY